MNTADKYRLNTIGQDPLVDKPKVKKWMSSKPVACEQCKQPLKHSFVDGRTAFGYWAVMCSVCHRNIGCGLGIGCGQRYDLNTLEKVGG